MRRVFNKSNLIFLTEFDNTMQMLLTAPPLHADGKRLFMPWFELELEAGVGITTGQGSDPQIMLDYSDDCTCSRRRRSLQPKPRL